MDYYRQIADKWQRFDDRAKFEVNRDLGPGRLYKLIGRNGLIFARGPFCWEFNADAKMYGGSFIPEMKAWCFTADIKQTVQFITRKACDLTAKRQQFLTDAVQTRLVRKRLCEEEGTIRIWEVPEVGLVFFRVVKELPATVLNDLKLLAKVKWCRYTDSNFTSALYTQELKKIVNDYLNAPKDNNFF